MEPHEFQQMMEERMMRVAEAVDRAMQGKADHEDWMIIKYECGLRPVNSVLNKMKGNQNASRQSH